MSAGPGCVLSSATVAVGAELATVCASVAVAPVSVPSVGVTETLTASPLSPWPAAPRSSVSVVELVPLVVLTVVPFTFQT